MTEREKFEAWMREREGYPYASQYANLMWAAWQAAIESRVLAERKQEPRWNDETVACSSCRLTYGQSHMLSDISAGRVVLTHPTPDDASDDTKRLDWLEQEDEMGFFYNIDHITANINEGFNGCKTLRDAIDRAMQDKERQG